MNYYDKAKKKVAEKKKFNKHLQSYLSTMAILFMMSFVMPPMRRVLGVVAFFWGIGLFAHYVQAHGFPGMEDEDEWEEKEIEKEVRRMQMKDRRKKAPLDDELDIDEHLDLDRPSAIPQKKYRDEDLV